MDHLFCAYIAMKKEKKKEGRRRTRTRPRNQRRTDGSDRILPLLNTRSKRQAMQEVSEMLLWMEVSQKSQGCGSKLSGTPRHIRGCAA